MFRNGTCLTVLLGYPLGYPLFRLVPCGRWPGTECKKAVIVAHNGPGSNVITRRIRRPRARGMFFLDRQDCPFICFLSDGRPNALARAYCSRDQVLRLPLDLRRPRARSPFARSHDVTEVPIPQTLARAFFQSPLPKPFHRSPKPSRAYCSATLAETSLSPQALARAE